LRIAENALRASATASPPYNMRTALIFHGVIVMAFGASVFFVRAKQVRREMDERMAQLSHTTPSMDVEAAPMEKMADESIKSTPEIKDSTPSSEESVHVDPRVIPAPIGISD